jgi:hypothetical protein
MSTLCRLVNHGSVSRWCKTAGDLGADDETTWPRHVQPVVDCGLGRWRQLIEEPLDHVWHLRGPLPKVTRPERLVHVPWRQAAAEEAQPRDCAYRGHLICLQNRVHDADSRPMFHACCFHVPPSSANAFA